MYEYIPDELEKKIPDIRYQLTKWLEKTIFRITTWDDEPLETLSCVACGGTQFNVGQGSYCTGIRCVTCGWEETIHTG